METEIKRDEWTPEGGVKLQEWARHMTDEDKRYLIESLSHPGDTTRVIEELKEKYNTPRQSSCILVISVTIQ